MNTAVERAIRYICSKYNEPLSLSDIAGSAILSRFHFCRVFRDVTGVTPGRFLSAVRIFQAKRMLVNTRLNVTDIAFAVGYNSLGSFSNHFTDSVGVSPGRFRRMARNGGFELPRPRRESSPVEMTLAGTAVCPRGYGGTRVYLGAFDSPIVQRRPVSSAVVEVPATAERVSYQLAGVPYGRWFVHAIAVADNADPEPWTRRTLLVGGSGPVTVAGRRGSAAKIELRPRRPTDLPILLALPDLEPQATDTVTEEDGLAPVADSMA